MLGKVYIKNDKDTSWTIAVYNNPVNINDLIKTGEKSRAEITLHTSQKLRIGENTKAQIREELNKVQVDTKKGKTWLNVILYDSQQFKIKTPTAVAAIRGTVYRVNCDTSSSMFRVYEGTVAVSPSTVEKDSIFLVSKGEEFVITNDVSAFIKNEKKKINDYMKNQNDLYDQFLMQEKNNLDNYNQKDEANFKKFHDLDYRISQFSAKEDSSDDWVQWNQNLDMKVKR